MRPERFELPTFWFVARRLIQLSLLFSTAYEFLRALKVAPQLHPQIFRLSFAHDRSRVLNRTALALGSAPAHGSIRSRLDHKSRARRVSCLIPAFHLELLPVGRFLGKRYPSTAGQSNGCWGSVRFLAPYPHGSLSREVALLQRPSRFGKMRKPLTMPMRPAEPKQPKRAVGGNRRSAAESDFKMAPSDTECLQQALREYREVSWDDSSFEELPFESQHTILRRAKEIKGRQHRLLSILDVRHPAASRRRTTATTSAGH